MIKKVNLTPQHKAELKRKVLEALDNNKNIKINSKNNIIKEDNSMVKAKKISKNLKKDVQLKKNSSVIKKKLNKSEIIKDTITNIKPPSSVLKNELSKISSKKNYLTTKNNKEFIINENKNQKSQIDWEAVFSSEPPDNKKTLFKLPSFLIEKKDHKETDLDDIFTQTKELKNKKTLITNRWLRLAITLLLALILVISFDILGIYKFKFKDPFSYQIMKAFNLPAGTINGSKLLLSDYYADLKFLSSAIAKKREGLPDLSAFSDISDKVFYRQVANILVRQKLAEYGKRVSNDFLNQQINILINQSGGVKQAESTINIIYGLKLSQFKEMILRPLIEREILQEVIANDESLEINKKAKEKAEMVLKIALTEGVDFNTLASQYTDDEIGVNTGGDLGWAMKGQLDSSWEGEIFALSEGSVLPKVVKNKFGYHIVKVEKKLSDPDTGKESVKLRHILIKVDVDKYIKELLDQATIKKYIK